MYNYTDCMFTTIYISTGATGPPPVNDYITSEGEACFYDNSFIS